MYTEKKALTYNDCLKILNQDCYEKQFEKAVRDGNSEEAKKIMREWVHLRK